MNITLAIGVDLSMLWARAIAATNTRFPNLNPPREGHYSQVVTTSYHLQVVYLHYYSEVVTCILMNYPVNTSLQLRAVLRALRQLRKLNQAEVGQLLGVNQKRVARIENAPGLTSFNQIARLVTALGGRVVIETPEPAPATTDRSKKRGLRKATSTQGNW